MPLPTPNSSNNKVRKAGSGTRPVVTSLATAKTAGSTTANLLVATGWTTATAVDVVMYRKDTENKPVPGTQTDWVATLSGTTLANMVLRAGTEPVSGYAADSLTVVKAAPTAALIDDLADAWYDEHKEDGSHGAVTADSVSAGSVTTSTFNSLTVSELGWYKDTQYFTASGTYTKPSGLKFVVVAVVGGGGGGGGASTTAASQGSGGGGGGGGGGAIAKILASNLAASTTVTVGAGGTVANNASGGSGGTSSFGAHAVATGGVGGDVMAAGASNSSAAGNPGGVGTAGDVLFRGTSGTGVVVQSNGATLSGAGGSSAIINGAGGGQTATNTNGSSGGVGSYGGGGSGARNQASQGSTRAGGAGTSGIVIVHEYF
jgi:hypothetical protein